jgi:hypothetical protein
MMTKVNLHKMRAISSDERVMACWTVNGQIRFRLKDSPTVKKVVNVYESLEKILK